jgi:hypothetical protein
MPSRRAGELFLAILEQKGLTIAGAVLDEAGAAIADELRGAALVRAGRAPATLVSTDAEVRPVELTWWPDQEASGYFDPADGIVLPHGAAMTLYQADLAWWLAWLAKELDLATSAMPTEIVAGLVWDLGDLWISRRRKVPILFARRLHLGDVMLELTAALAKRAGRNGGLILTSTRNPRIPEVFHPFFKIVPLIELLRNDTAFSLDRALLLSPFVGRAAPAANLGPVFLSPDGRLLVINGTTEIPFSSDVQIRAIRMMVEAHSAGQRFAASTLLKKAGSNHGSFGRAFGSKKWAQLRRFLNSHEGLWGFDL